MLWWTLNQLKSDDWKSREAAARKLGGLRDVRAVPPLISTLADHNSEVRQAVKTALLKIGRPAIPNLADALADQNRTVSSAAAGLLVKFGEEAIFEIGRLLNHPDSFVKERAANLLARVGDPSALNELASAVRQGDLGAKEAAAAALTRIGPAALDTLGKLFLDKKSRATSAAALVRLGSVAVPLLVGFLKHTDTEVQESAATALGMIGDGRALKPLEVLYESASPKQKSVLATALKALGWQEKKTSLSTPIHTRLNPDSSRLGKRPSPSNKLEKEAHSPDPKARQMALVELTNARTDKAVRVLIEALHDPESSVRGTAARGLLQIGSLSEEPLMAALKNENASVRRASAHALAQNDDSRGLSVLAADLESVSDLILLDAADSLVELGQITPFQPLLRLLTDLSSSLVRDDFAQLYKVKRTYRLLHRLIERFGRDIPEHELRMVFDLPEEKRQSFVAYAATPSEDLPARVDEEEAEIHEGVEPTLDCSRLRELARRELARRNLMK